jgi:hypothetical protein
LSSRSVNRWDPRRGQTLAVIVHRQGDEYTAQVGPPETGEVLDTDRPYQRDELRWKIEALGVHPIDVGDAFDQADRRAGESGGI